MTRIDLHESSKLTFAEGAAPSTPAAGLVLIYAKTDGNLYQKDDAGTETGLAGGGSVADHNHTAAGGDGGDLDAPVIDGHAVFNEESAPSTPASTTVAVYAKSDGRMYSKDDAGAESPMSGFAPAGARAINASQSVTNSEAKIPLGSSDWADGVTFDNANDRLTILTAGRYLVVGRMDQSGTALTTTQYIGVYKNGSVLQYMEVPSKGSAACSLALIETCAVNDYFELFGFATTTQTWTSISLTVERVA